MQRTEYLELCQKVSVLKNGICGIKENVTDELKVIYNGIAYYPVAYELSFDDKGNIKYFDGTSEQTENKKFDTYYDTIILQKIDGKWKVVYSNLQFEENQVYHEEVIY